MRTAKLAIFDDLPERLRRALSGFPVYLSDADAVAMANRLGVDRAAAALERLAPEFAREIGHPDNLDIKAWLAVRFVARSL
jgi:hypothetical protein